MFTRILVPTDFSESSDAALDYARALADKFGASLRLLHVIEQPYGSGAFSNEVYLAETSGLYDMLVKQAQAQLSDRVFPADRAQHGMTSEIMTGRSATTIVEYAADQHFDLIVMGTHGRTGLAHLFMGSVAEHVVRKALCPVLTVRQAPAAAAAAVATVSRPGRTSRFDTAPGLG